MINVAFDEPAFLLLRLLLRRKNHFVTGQAVAVVALIGGFLRFQVQAVQVGDIPALRLHVHDVLVTVEAGFILAGEVRYLALLLVGDGLGRPVDGGLGLQRQARRRDQRQERKSHDSHAHTFLRSE